MVFEKQPEEGKNESLEVKNMLCPKCGTWEISNHDNFCSWCAAPVDKSLFTQSSSEKKEEKI